MNIQFTCCATDSFTDRLTDGMNECIMHAGECMLVVT
jgi:hypothetical protein